MFYPHSGLAAATAVMHKPPMLRAAGRPSVLLGVLLSELAALPAQAGGAASPRQHLLDRATVTIVERRTIDAEAAKAFPCSRFMRSDAEARRFLRTASTVTGEQTHYEFYVYHCAVSGTVDGPSGRAEFSIVLGGTGTLRFADGSYLLLGCRRKCCSAARSACFG